MVSVCVTWSGSERQHDEGSGVDEILWFTRVMWLGQATQQGGGVAEVLWFLFVSFVLAQRGNTTKGRVLLRYCGSRV